MASYATDDVTVETYNYGHQYSDRTPRYTYSFNSRVFASTFCVAFHLPVRCGHDPHMCKQSRSFWFSTATKRTDTTDRIAARLASVAGR